MEGWKQAWCTAGAVESRARAAGPRPASRRPHVARRTSQRWRCSRRWRSSCRSRPAAGGAGRRRRRWAPAGPPALSHAHRGGQPGCAPAPAHAQTWSAGKKRDSMSAVLMCPRRGAASRVMRKYGSWSMAQGMRHRTSLRAPNMWGKVSGRKAGAACAGEPGQGRASSATTRRVLGAGATPPGAGCSHTHPRHTHPGHPTPGAPAPRGNAILPMLSSVPNPKMPRTWFIVTHLRAGGGGRGVSAGGAARPGTPTGRPHRLP